MHVDPTGFPGGDDAEDRASALRSAIHLLHGIASLVHSAAELQPTCYALLTGVTAGVGLGLNRAMLFLVDDARRDVLRGAAAVGPADGEEAGRVWRAIEAVAPDLEALYQAGLGRLADPGRLDADVRRLEVDVGGSSPIALAMRRDRLVAGEGGDDLGGLLHLPTAVAAPLGSRSMVHGVLYADNCFTGKPLDPTRSLVFAMLADHAGSAIENARHLERISRAARIDSLTGLGHHGTLMVDLECAVAAAARDGNRPLGLVMIDLDDFKAVNDTHGHLAGDAMLIAASRAIAANVRSGADCYRFGGDEFAVILPGTDGHEASAAAERIRAAVQAAAVDHLGLRLPPARCSAGVASFPRDASDASSLVSAADAALLAAKAAGKHRVAAAGRP